MTEKARKAGAAPEATVRVTVHLSLDTYRLLQDVALSHALDDTAAVATRRAPSRRPSHTVEEVIAKLVEKHAAELENQARIVRPPVRR